MEHSNELRDLMLRFYEATTSGDLSFLENHVSRREGTVFVGTDPNEWWEGFEAFAQAMRAQSEAMGGGGDVLPEQLFIPDADRGVAVDEFPLAVLLKEHTGIAEGYLRAIG